MYIFIHIIHVYILCKYIATFLRFTSLICTHTGLFLLNPLIRRSDRSAWRQIPFWLHLHRSILCTHLPTYVHFTCIGRLYIHIYVHRTILWTYSPTQIISLYIFTCTVTHLPAQVDCIHTFTYRRLFTPPIHPHRSILSWDGFGFRRGDFWASQCP